jgi:hypothetical protein
MSKKALMNMNGSLGHGTGSLVTLGVFVITSVPSLKVKAEGGGVFFEKVDFTFSGGNASGCDPGTVMGSGSVLASSTKNRDNSTSSKYVMRLDDETITGPFQGTLSGNPVSLGNQPVKISSAGQSKVIGE